MSHNPSIRKAAILVSLLDSRSADALLEPMGEELAVQVRQAVMDLDEISEEEQDEVLSEFFGRGQSSGDVGGGVEIELSGSDVPPKAPLTVSSSAPARDVLPPSFAFLENIPPDAVAQVLSAEHPQAVAVVVAHLPAEVAGRVLERLNPALATEALSRMAWLTIPAPEVLADLASELRSRLAPIVHRCAANPASLAGVQAILATLKGQCRSQLIDRLAEHDQLLASRLSLPEATGNDDNIGAARYSLDSGPRQPHSTNSPPLFEFEDLLLLGDRDLASLAAAASGQCLALALLDADERLTRRVLALLPAQQAAELRSRLAHPGPLRLKDIDAAQRQLAELARQLASHGHITLPPSRHFAAAA